MSIPKLIHYVWVGKKEKSELIKYCISSWKKYMPDYHIIEWNEDNYNINKNMYISKAYSEGKWAFVADYMRFDILNQLGGIYFDTDVELIQRIPDNFLNYHAFCGFENMGYVNPGLIFACEKNCKLVREILSSFEYEEFCSKGRMYTINERMTDILVRLGLSRNNKFQVIEEVVIFPMEYFCGFDPILKEPMITDNTLSVHHYAATWVSNNLKVKNKIRNLIKLMIGKKLFKRIIKLKQRFTRKDEGGSNIEN